MIALETSVKGVRALKKYEEENQSDNADSEISETEKSDGRLEDNEDEDNDDQDDATRESDAESENSASEDEKTGECSNNAGWADVMQKILRTNRPKRKKTIVLSKAKKLTDIGTNEKTPENLPFEIETEDGETRKEKILPKKEKKEGDEDDTIVSKKKKKDVQLGIRVKPSFRDRDRERALQKIATKGVVQLFNVVKQQQTEIDKKIIEVGPLERKREQVLKSIDKRAFLDVLMGGSKSIPVDAATNSTKIEDNKTDKVWSVLRDEFVMGAKLKDWDKKAPEEDDDSTSSEEMDSD